MNEYENTLECGQDGEFKAAPLRGADLNSISDARISEADSESNEKHHRKLFYWVLQEITDSHKYTEEFVCTNLVGVDYTDKFTFASSHTESKTQIQSDFCLGCGNYTISNTLAHFANTGIESFDRLLCDCRFYGAQRLYISSLFEVFGKADSSN